MLEVYLFINPLGSRCMKSEKYILRLADQIFGDISYQFIPLLNPQMIDQHLKATNQDCHNLELRNEQFDLHYRIILDYKAALFQGKKKGRLFLLNLQNQLVEQGQPYSERLVMEIAKHVRLDLEMFKEDRQSELARRAFQADQRLASEMNVAKPSTAILYNADVSECGLMLTDVTYQALYDICENNGLLAEKALEQKKSTPNLHIL
ncbi:DsbA family protein [Lactobacillus sp. LC28-10]|uniref:DsbA family protein n=1 Tax=Secundilactobacillus angelensis TaxID=2722706 RepID=A0ABX1KYI6_9LACO|nr:DsbA family protein [Secundilactobacillus angelensis]MCH5463149.1 DsbA family protein [Secundilactobacillus angelensis]NLR19002.1 DsbA family protein [Secundilactobacillus angelensis]